MKLYKDKDFKVQVADIETLKGCILLKFYNPDTKEWVEFEISKYKNEVEEFVRFYTSDNIDYAVYFNGIDFDGVVIQYIIENYDQWLGLDGYLVARRIYSFVQAHIDDRKYKIAAKFKEKDFSVKVIDVYTLLGLDNEARRSSLKKCEFQLDWWNVEEMPIEHTREDLSEEEIEIVSKYCENDILATYELLKVAIGDTHLAVYKGNNQLELRQDIKEEFGLECINLSDIRIGDELLKLAYAREKNTEVNKLPRKGFFRKRIDLKKCIPSYVEFKTEQFQNLLKEIKKASISQTDKWERKFEFKGTQYIQALGGLHSVNESQRFVEDENYAIYTCDVSSMYPAGIVNNGYYPYHLGKELLNVYKKLYERRLEIKPLTKTDKKIKGISDAIKLILNSVFGKMGSMESWLYDKQALLSVTLTGQFSLLMLIEALELEGFHVIIANTDGIETIVKRDKVDRYLEICKEWEQKTGFNLEFDQYSKIFMSTVNDYFAVTTSEKIKTKGDLITDFELWKNKSSRIVALATQEYFKNGTNPTEFIRNHKNIFDFCIMARATGDLYLEEQWDENGKIVKKTHKKLVRYYLSKGSNHQLFKRGVGSTGKNMNVNQRAANELGEIYIQYYNQHSEKEDYKIDYNQYIFSTFKLIDKCQGSKLAKNFIESLKPVYQGSLF